MISYFAEKIGAAVKKKTERWKRRKRYHALSRLKAVEFAGDPNYALSLVGRCYLDKKRNLDDEAILKRIVRSYKRAKAVQKEADSVYQVGNEWLPIYEKHLGPVMRSLTNEDIPALRSIYQNFMRDACSTGLVGLPVDMKKHYFSGGIRYKYQKLHLHSSLHRMKLWRSLIGDKARLTDLRGPDIGNPTYYSIDGQLVQSGSDYQHYYASIILRLTDELNRRVIAELGGGYGGMAYYLIRNSVNMTYIDFDLPENMALTAYYLLNAFPEKKALLYGEADLTTDTFGKYDMIIMPNFELERMSGDSVDLTFNSYSLAEMSRETIAAYISNISRITRKYILHVNHTRQSVVKADDFGIDIKRFKLIYKMPALWNAGVNMDMDEFEYLYEKRNQL